MNPTDEAKIEDDMENWGMGDSESTAVATYPEHPANPHNHRFTISMNGQGPMLVVRGNTAADVTAAFEELEDASVGAAIGRAWAAFKAGAALGNGLGATPVPQGPNAPANFANPGGHFNVPPAAQGATPPPFGPNVSVPGAPGFQGNAGFPAPPAAPAVQNNAPEFQQNGWYRLNVPFPKKGAFDAIVQQYQIRKGRPTEGGGVSFNKADKSWYVSREYAGAFTEFSPMPA